MPFERQMCLCVFVIKKKKSQRGERDGKEKTEGKKQLLLMTYIDRSHGEDRKGPFLNQ